MKYVFVLAMTLFLGSAFVVHAATVIDITFPVDGETSYSDDFYDARSGGRYHYATDILADKMTPVQAVVDGRITFAPMTEPSYGYMLTLRGDDGYEYNYIHLNNDTPGTDDGNGGHEHAYVDGIYDGVRVERGQHIAWVGDSGNAESVGAHLHFEIYDGDTPINPYLSLQAAQDDGGLEDGDLSYDREQELARATSISADKDLDNDNDGELCASDSLIRTPEVSTVYYCGTDGGRYVFQNESTFFSWYNNFNDVDYVTTEEMAAIPLKGSVTYRPGSVMLKILSDPKIYAIGHGGSLHWVTSPALAEAIYGDSWATFVRDIPDGFWGAYDLDDPVTID